MNEGTLKYISAAVASDSTCETACRAEAHGVLHALGSQVIKPAKLDHRGNIISLGPQSE